MFGEESESYDRYLRSCVDELRQLGLFEDADAILEAISKNSETPAEMFAEALALSAGGRHDQALAEISALLDLLASDENAGTLENSLLTAAMEISRIEMLLSADKFESARHAAGKHLMAMQDRFTPEHDRMIVARAIAAYVRSAGDPDGGLLLLRDLLRSVIDAEQFGLAKEILGTLSAATNSVGAPKDKEELATLGHELSTRMQADRRFGGFETQATGSMPSEWMISRYLMSNSGAIAFLDVEQPFEGLRCLRISGLRGIDRVLMTSNAYRNIYRQMDAREYRGKHVRFSAAVRVQVTDDEPQSQAQLWLRVDRPNLAKPTLFDNMNDRPIRSAEWARYEISGRVHDDAEGLAMGLMVLGEATAWMDDVRFEVVDPPGGSGQAAETQAGQHP